MKIIQSFVYKNQVSNEEGLLDTWGVAAFAENFECFLFPDVSVDSTEAKKFAVHILQNEIDTQTPEAAVNEFIERLYDVNIP